MTRLSSIAIAVAFAFGASAAMAQTVQRGATQQGAAAAQTPVQVAQAPAGGASVGATTAPAIGGVGVAGTVASTVVFVGAAAAGLVGVSSGTNTPTSH